MSGAVPGGTRSMTSAAVPTDSRGIDDEAVVERRVVDGDAVEALADLERDALPAVLERHPGVLPAKLEPGPPKDERTMGVVLELGLGIDPPAAPST